MQNETQLRLATNNRVHILNLYKKKTLQVGPMNQIRNMQNDTRVCLGTNKRVHISTIEFVQKKNTPE